MVTHYMPTHNQCLHMACQGVEETYLVSFRLSKFLGGK